MGLQTKKIKYADHWGEIELNEVCNKITDGTHFTPTYLLDGVAFISVKDIYDNKVDFSRCKYISKEQHAELIQRCYPEKDDLLVTKSGTIGRMAIVPETPEFSLFVSVALIKNKKYFVTTMFLKYCLENYFNNISIDQDIKGGLLKNFHLEDIRLTLVPVVSLAEQHRIVAKLEELFSSLDKGIEALKTAQAQLKVYRQAVLKYAFEGRLTNPNIKEGELPEGWIETKLTDVSDKITDGEHFRPKTVEKGVPFLSAKDVRDNGVSFDYPLFISEETAEKALQRCNPNFGDILIVSRGATVGRMCLVNTDKIFCLLGSVILIKANDKVLSPYLLYYLKSSSVNQKIITVSGATAQQAIYLRDIKNINILLPTKEEQYQIIQEIESRLSVCDKIEESIMQSLQQAEALRQSILKKAFEGKLVPQDPHDEPANLLLKRILAERNNSKPSKTVKALKTKKIKAK